MLLIWYSLILLITFYITGVVCDRFFVPSLDEIADRFKLPPDIVGAVFMAAGSSAPELFVVLFAVLLPGESENIGVGMIVGSAMVNTLGIIGLSVMARRSTFTWQPVVRDFLFYALTLGVMLWMFWDGVIRPQDAWMLLGLYVVYLILMPVWRKIFPYTDRMDILEEIEVASLGYLTKKKNILVRFLSYLIPDVIQYPKLYGVTFSLSLVAIAGLSYVLVESVVAIADILSINSTLIALSVVSIGSSIPDMISSIIVSRKGKSDMIISNAVGSNIFDIAIALGLPWVVYFLINPGSTIQVDTENLVVSVLLLFATILAVLAVLVVRKWTVGLKTGIALLGMYGVYLGYLMWLVFLS